ncbi:MAG: ABC transporter permease subunit, partial [Hyphomicrobiales bacterium]|nr:ABC transporter permease subunit [Hyphomicrobiales bacterium]
MSTERGAPRLLQRLSAGNAFPIFVVVFFILIIWYVAAFFMNLDLQRDAFANADQAYSTSDLVEGTMSQDRPRLPAPHQIAAEIDKTVFELSPSSKRSLVYHGAVTLEATLLGFAIGSALGMLLAVMIVHAASLERSLMPWIIASQTIPIIALAPMIVVIMNQFDVTGIVPKATISAYLSFFPVTVGMVKGLRSPDPLQLD